MRRFGLTLFILFCLGSCSKPPLHREEAYVFGTRVEVLVAALPEAQARAAVGAVLREFDRLHRTYHAWRASELSELNAAIAEGKPLAVTPEMAALIVQAQRLSALGDSRFDPGIGALVRLWGFQSDDFAARLPEPAALAAWRAARPSIADIEIDGLRVMSHKREVALDFGGYLKGVALDRAAAILRAHGAANALVNIGGNVMALGSRNGARWRVGIQHPRAPGPIATVELADGEAIGTSGDYQRYFETDGPDGRRYCHVLDPETGEPVMHTQSLTILVRARSDAGTLSDAMTKPLFIAGAAWPQLARKMALDEVLRVDREGKVQASAALHRRLEFVGVDAKSVEIVP